MDQSRVVRILHGELKYRWHHCAHRELNSINPVSLFAAGVERVASTGDRFASLQT